jgi:plasmid stabilization system protein ParE
MAQIRFTAAARAYLADALAWYESHAPEIVPRFRQSLRVMVQRIAQPSPHHTRQALLRRFPYLVIFRETGESVFVIALFHTSRDPRIWQQRTS